MRKLQKEKTLEKIVLELKEKVANEMSSRRGMIIRMIEKKWKEKEGKR